MAISTEGSYLLYKAANATAYSKLVDIKEFPDLGSAPDTLDTTTLSDHQKKSILDILDPGALEFTCNYTKEDYSALKAIEAKGAGQKFAVAFGCDESAATETITGTDGFFTFEGELAVYVKGGSVSAVTEMGVSIAVSSEIALTDPSIATS